jgi:predicted MPP superfamily phosphohydrolase
VLFLGFFATALLLVAGIHWYLWRRLIHNTTRPGRVRRAVTGGFLVLPLLLLGALLGTRLLPRAGERYLAWVGYVWLAVMFYLLLVLLVLEVPVVVLRYWPRRHAAVVAGPALVAARVGADAEEAPGLASAPDPQSWPGLDHGRRRLLARSAAIVAGLAATGVTGYGATNALGPPHRDRVRIHLPKLPGRLDGLRIALVADIHLGPILGRSHTVRIVDAINAMEPDLVAIVGDLVDGTVAELGPAAEPLRRLRSRQGSFFVTGNHEYFSGYQEWIDEIDSFGVRVLRNDRVEIDGLDLAGVNDVTGRFYGDPPDFDRALGGRDPAKPVVLLAHQPVQAPEAARRGVDLQLSGHTHGGQIWPFTLAVRLQQPIVAGLGRVGGTAVYVTRGAGFWGPPVRVGAPPDITLVELRSA